MPAEKKTHRKFITLGSLFLAITSLVSVFSYQLGICTDGHDRCYYSLQSIGVNTFVFVPIFVFSLITYFTRKEVYKLWLVWSLLWGVVFSFFILLSGGGRGSGAGLHDAYEGLFLIVLFGLYPVVSALLIIWKYWHLSLKKK